MLDSEGGYTVWGNLTPAARLSIGGLPIGLASHINSGGRRCRQSLTWDDVEIDNTDPAYRFRREMESAFANSGERS